MEAEFMVDSDFIETQISTEQTKPYKNRGARVAMNDTFHLLSKDAANWSGAMTVMRVLTKLQSTWTRVMSVAATSVQLPSTMLVPEAADPDQVREERAIVA